MSLIYVRSAVDRQSKEAQETFRFQENDGRLGRKASGEQYAGQYYRAIPSEMPRLGLLGMSHCKQWTMRLLLLHNGRSLARDLTWPLPPSYLHLHRSHEHHLRRGHKSTPLPSPLANERARYRTACEINSEE